MKIWNSVKNEKYGSGSQNFYVALPKLILYLHWNKCDDIYQLIFHIIQVSYTLKGLKLSKFAMILSLMDNTLAPRNNPKYDPTSAKNVPKSHRRISCLLICLVIDDITTQSLCPGFPIFHISLWGKLFQVDCLQFGFKHPLHSVWKSTNMSHFWILAFSTKFRLIIIDLSCSPVWPQASAFQKLAKMDNFWHFLMNFCPLKTWT